MQQVSFFADILDFLNAKLIWGLPMVVLMLSTGAFLTIRTRGMLFRRFGTVMRYTLGSLFCKRNKQTGTAAITPFQAVCTALAGTVGTGNIVGVALAIATGGPGALFWLWVSAAVGMVVKFGEVTLAVAYRRTNSNGQTVGGPMYYIATGLKKKTLAIAFAVFGALAAFGIGAMVQANSLTAGVQSSLALSPEAIGIATAVLAMLVIVGGIRRIARVAEYLVPFMAGFYILGALIVIGCHVDAIPSALGAVFRGAFSGTAATGGFLGAGAMYACRIGMARGVFTHEAGMGSAPIAHAAADTDHPARQGLWGAFEVFFDSIIMCTVTGLVILTTNVWCADPMMDESAMSIAAFADTIPAGGYIVGTGLALFAFATIIAWYYYGEKCVEFLFGEKPAALRLYQLTYVVLVYVGCVAGLHTVWALADLFNGLMAIPNLLALWLLSPNIQRLSADFFRDPHRIRKAPDNAQQPIDRVKTVATKSISVFLLFSLH